MLPYQIIEQKAQGDVLTDTAITDFINAYTKGSIPDYQMSALLMAIFIRGMNAAETLALTRVMLDSGERMDFSAAPGFVADKHSTGGVGDKVSIPLAPILAVLGVHVPMISGRGLGHSGGTLDKLESVPGFNVHLDLKSWRDLVMQENVGLIGQTGTICPADKKLYALRDVTATVRSIPLISASIMSKKIAEGIQGLVLDVKTGNGAFMQTVAEARELAHSLVSIGQGYGIKTTALITDMNQPLGSAIGNWFEMKESVLALQGA
ncbi:MAG: thymidine phosphorylase, partial [Candidatus Marinimicrobia bacterium]|nr:thymidine phosphorylase [Candidatus Neomarinimicrobiota bacterium]